MKNLSLSKTGKIVNFPQDGKYVNYNKTEDKVNYHGGPGPVDPVEPIVIKDIPESRKPALEDIPEGVTIAINNDARINFVAPSDYVENVRTPVIGLGIRDGENAFIMGVEAGSGLKWDNSTTLQDIPSLFNFLDRDYKIDFSSKENTDKILSVLPTQAEAALYCRNYTAAGIGVNRWDLPAAGILNVIVAKKSEIVSALNTLGKPSNWTSDAVWSSTEIDADHAEGYVFYDNYGWDPNLKGNTPSVIPIYELYHQETDLSVFLQDHTLMPTGVSIVDLQGKYVPVADWHTGDDWTGIALNTGTWKGIFGIANSYEGGTSSKDDLSISSYKRWSKYLDNKIVPGVVTTTDMAEAKKDFASKANTDAIMAALGSNPSETDNAALVCRNYSKGVLNLKGKWDLPAAGIIGIITRELKADLDAAVEKMGSSSPFDVYWSSTQYNVSHAWQKDLMKSGSLDSESKNSFQRVIPVHELYYEIPIEEVELPTGVSVVDGSGHVFTDPSQWSADKGLTGLGISDGTNKFIMGVADSIVNEIKDDMSINSRKYWSNALYGTDVPDVLTTLDIATAITDFKSKENTDAILAALASSSNPQETNNAAVVCRNYEAGIGKKGMWDLPAAGIVDMIVAKKSAIVSALNAIGKPSNIFSSYYVWPSTEYDSYFSWSYNFYSSNWHNITKDTSNFVLPILELSIDKTVPVNPKDLVLPEGLCIIDDQGTILSTGDGVQQWKDSGKGLTGIGINDGTHKFILGISSVDYSVMKDDLSVNTRKFWSSALATTDVPGVLTTSDASEPEPGLPEKANIAKTDFKSKENTDAILTALASSSNPSETNNAAVVCRNYEAGIGKKGMWDLPAAGIVDIIQQKQYQLRELLLQMNNSFANFLGSDLWTSTESSPSKAWIYSFNQYGGGFNGYSGKTNAMLSIPVLTIA